MIKLEDNKSHIRQVETTVKDYNYISKIESIVGRVKNVVFEVEISKYKVFEYKNYALLILKLKDDTDSISAWLMANRDKSFADILKMIEKDNAKYLIKGDVFIVDIEDEEFIDIMNEIRGKGMVIEEDFINRKTLAIKAIECLD